MDVWSWLRDLGLVATSSIPDEGRGAKVAIPTAEDLEDFALPPSRLAGRRGLQPAATTKPPRPQAVMPRTNIGRRHLRANVASSP